MQIKQEKQRQYRTIHGTGLACILLCHFAQKISARWQPYLNLFVQPDKKAYSTIRTSAWCGIALIIYTNLSYTFILTIWEKKDKIYMIV